MSDPVTAMPEIMESQAWSSNPAVEKDDLARSSPTEQSGDEPLASARGRILEAAAVSIDSEEVSNNQAEVKDEMLKNQRDGDKEGREAHGPPPSQLTRESGNISHEAVWPSNVRGVRPKMCGHPLWSDRSLCPQPCKTCYREKIPSIHKFLVPLWQSLHSSIRISVISRVHVQKYVRVHAILNKSARDLSRRQELFSQMLRARPCFGAQGYWTASTVLHTLQVRDSQNCPPPPN
jgi:hypothetical protein